MSIFIKQNFSHPLKVFLSETLYKIFHLTNIFEWVNFHEKISYQWNIRKPSKIGKYQLEKQQHTYKQK